MLSFNYKNRQYKILSYLVAGIVSVSACLSVSAQTIAKPSVSKQAAPVGSLLIQWEAPKTLANGRPFANKDALTGFKIYASQQPYDLAPMLITTVYDPKATSAYLTGLSSGTWYFWVSATTSTAESELHFNRAGTIQ